MHVSTDCVFTGSRGGYTEADTPDASGLYGRSKLLGEVTDVPGAVTVRTSIVGWEIRQPTGVLEWFANQRGSRVAGFTKAIFSGLSTSDLVGVIEQLCSEWRDVDGLWHVSTELISKYDLLTSLRDALGWDIDIVPTDEPVIDRSLDSTRFRQRLGAASMGRDGRTARRRARTLRGSAPVRIGRFDSAPVGYAKSPVPIGSSSRCSIHNSSGQT